jgi:Flp pilus assembly protein TadG
MSNSTRFPGWRSRVAALACRDDRGSQMVEFAVTLPLLMVFVVGIFDFSGAFTLKQKLTNAARDAARAAAAEPASDLGRTLPMSVNDAFLALKNYLATNQINDCGITASGSPTGLTWQFTASGNGCNLPGLTLTINRGYYFSQTAANLPSVSCASQTPGSGQVAVVGTCVSIQYPYPWRFGRVASLLGAATTLPTQVSATAVALNEN